MVPILRGEKKSRENGVARCVHPSTCIKHTCQMPAVDECIRLKGTQISHAEAEQKLFSWQNFCSSVRVGPCITRTAPFNRVLSPFWMVLFFKFLLLFWFLYYLLPPTFSSHNFHHLHSKFSHDGVLRWRGGAVPFGAHFRAWKIFCFVLSSQREIKEMVSTESYLHLIWPKAMGINVWCSQEKKSLQMLTRRNMTYSVSRPLIRYLTHARSHTHNRTHSYSTRNASPALVSDSPHSLKEVGRSGNSKTTKQAGVPLPDKPAGILKTLVETV